VKKNSKKRSVKKNNDEIEVSLGGPSITKYEIMTSIAKKYSIYGSTVWLNTPIPEKDNKTPAELMMEGDLKAVKDLISKPDEKLDS